MTSRPLRSFKIFTLFIPGFCGLILLLSASLAFAEFSESVVNEAKECTVRITTDRGSGTGFVINRQGNIGTNYHVVENAATIDVIFVRGDKAFEIPATVVASKPGKDLVILKCDLPFSIPPFTIVSRPTIGGQNVMALGFPGVLDKSFSPSSTDGIRPTGNPGEYRINDEVINFLTPVTFPGNVGKEMMIASLFGGTFQCIAHDAKISEGNSGGPLIDIAGRVVGVNTQVAGSDYGIDYAFAIHASELVALARAHSIPMDVTSSRASSAGIHLLLYVVLAAFAVVMFLMVQRKPRAVMVDAMSRMIRSTKHDRPSSSPRQGHGSAVTPAKVQGSMRLRGRDLQGISFDVEFSNVDFRRHGGRLVIGRNNELSQLAIPHDSVSRQHATLNMNGSSIQVEDRNSGNGTMVNGREIPVGAPPVSLNPGDKLTLGEVDLIFEVFH